MTLSAVVYKNRSLTEAERATITRVFPETGEPIIDLDDDSFLFVAHEMWLGNIMGIGDLRRELEKSSPSGSQVLQEFVVPSGIRGAVISEPNISRIISEASNLLVDERHHLSENLQTFLVEFRELAKIAIKENNPIVLL